jgi:hypothetical protein
LSVVRARPTKMRLSSPLGAGRGVVAAIGES